MTTDALRDDRDGGIVVPGVAVVGLGPSDRPPLHRELALLPGAGAQGDFVSFVSCHGVPFFFRFVQITALNSGASSTDASFILNFALSIRSPVSRSFSKSDA
jgi:hypothetical protein